MCKRARVALAVAGALAMGAMPLTAQQGPRGRMGVGPRVDGIEALIRQRGVLGLSDEQVAALRELRTELRASVEPIHEEMREAARQAREEERARREALRERMERFQERIQSVQQDHRDRVEGLLTEEQRQRLEEMELRRARAGRGGGAWRRPGVRDRRGGAWRGPARTGPQGLRGGVGVRGRVGVGLGVRSIRSRTPGAWQRAPRWRQLRPGFGGGDLLRSPPAGGEHQPPQETGGAGVGHPM